MNSAGNYNLFDAADATYTYLSQVSTNKIEGTRADFATTGSLLANDNSVLIVLNDDGDLVAYTGVKNFPTITGSGLVVKGLVDKNTNYVKAAFVDARDAKIEDNAQDSLTLFLKKTSTYIDTTDNEEVDVWSVIMDGEVKSIEVKDGNGVDSFKAGYTYYKLKVDKDGFYEESDDYKFNGDEKSTMKTGAVLGELGVENNALKFKGTVFDNEDNTGESEEKYIGSYILTADTQIVVVMRPTEETINGYSVSGNAQEVLREEQMVDRSADWETKIVTAKQLDNMFGNYDAVKGTWYVVRNATDSNVVNKVILDINGVQ